MRSVAVVCFIAAVAAWPFGSDKTADPCGPDERLVIKVPGSVREQRGTCDRRVFPFLIDDAAMNELGQLIENYLAHPPHPNRMTTVCASLVSLMHNDSTNPSPAAKCLIQGNEKLKSTAGDHGKEVEGLKAELAEAQAALAAKTAELAAFAAKTAELAAKTAEHAALTATHDV
jgi:hypothetical protein